MWYTVAKIFLSLWKQRGEPSEWQIGYNYNECYFKFINESKQKESKESKEFDCVQTNLSQGWY